MSVIEKIQDIFKTKPASHTDSIDTPSLATPVKEPVVAVKSPGADHGAEAAIGKKNKDADDLPALLVPVSVLMLVQLIWLTRQICCACQFWEAEPPHSISEHC